jgi:GDP-D-mannose 3',5'-epimerase
MRKVLVMGAGGFIGHHLVKQLKKDGFHVRGVDLKYPEYEPTAADEFFIRDLRDPKQTRDCFEGGFDDVYQLAADMGGIGYITANVADIAWNNTLINLNVLKTAQQWRIKRYLYTSSACVYAHDKQTDEHVTPLKEEDAYPAMPEPGYGWEKLYAELMCEYFAKDYHMDVRIVRFHNVYGPLGTYDGGKEKSPAAICRKVAKAADGTGIEVWGDGKQTRSYMFIDDCVEGLMRIMESGYNQPLNLGTEELVSIDTLVEMVSVIAGKSLRLHHDTTKPQGVRGRNSDNTRLRKVLGWEPQTKLMDGLVPTYRWIKKQCHSRS